MSLVVFLLACHGGGDQFTYSGYAMHDFFPFDGERTWEFTDADPTVDHTVQATLDSAYQTVNGASVYTVNYAQCALPADSGTTPDCTPEPWRISAIGWSSDGGQGVLIHDYTDANGVVALDPPLMVADKTGAPGDSWVTATDGQTFTSTFVALEACPVIMNVDWTTCAHLRVDDDADPTTPTSYPLAGDLWAVAGFDVIGFQLSDDAGQWQLSNTTYSR